MTEEEWQQLYPEDWHPASEAEGYNPNRFDLKWNADYSAFRAVELSWGADKSSYIQYQCQE